MIRASLTALGFALAASAACAAPLDLGSWSAHTQTNVNQAVPASWQVSGSSLAQTANSQASLFLSNGAPATTLHITGQLRSSGGDNDYLGFGFGIGGGDWLLIDWKQTQELVDFTGGQDNQHGAATAQAGLAASLVIGNPSGAELWGHTNFGNSSSRVSELARAASLGNTGYTAGQWYAFDILLAADSLKFSIDGVEQFTVNGSFADGSWGFYSFAQEGAEFRSLDATDPNASKQEAADGTVPTPTSLLLTGAALLALGGLRRRA